MTLRVSDDVLTNEASRVVESVTPTVSVGVRTAEAILDLLEIIEVAEEGGGDIRNRMKTSGLKLATEEAVEDSTHDEGDISI